MRIFLLEIKACNCQNVFKKSLNILYKYNINII